MPGALLAFAAGWGWPGLFFASSIAQARPLLRPHHPDRRLRRCAVGPLVFGLVAEAASYQVAWLVCGAFALGAGPIVAGRRMILRDRRVRAGELSTRGR